MIKSDKDGVVKSLFVPCLNDVDIHMFIHVGSEVRSFTNSNDAIGEVIVKGVSLEECEKILNDAISQIVIEYE